MKKSMVSVMMMAVVANTVLAGELPFTAKLTPGQEPNSGDNMVKFVIENNAMETITGVVITRNNGRLFDYVVQLGAGVGGVITSPSVYVGALGASTVGYIREFWQYNNDGTMNSEIGPEWLTGYLRGPEGYEPTHRTVVRTGFFSTYENVGNYFAARNHGYLRVPSGGTHYFRMSVDDHGYVMFRRADGTEVVLFSENYNANKGVMHNSSQNPVMFTAGEIVYFEAFQIEVDGSDYLRLEWAKPWTPPSTLATPALRSEALDAFNAWLKKPTTYHMINNGNGDDPNRLILDDDKSLYWDGRWRWIKDGDVTDQVKFEIITYLTFPETYNIAWSKLPVSNFSTKRPAGTTVPLTIFPALDDGSMIMNNGPSSAIRIAGLDVKMGEKISFEAALEELIVKNYGYAPQEVLWNLNDQTAKTTIEVFGANGNSSMITLGSTPRTDNAEYEFKSTARPVRLEVKSIGADGEINERAARFRVVVIDPTIEGDDKEVYRYDALGDTPSQAWANPDNLRAGMQVTFEAAEEIYFDEERHFLYHTYNASEFGDKVGLAVERYVAWGLSVNGTPQTGDPTRYSFEINADTKIEFRTRHEYALDVASDFSQTLAHLKTSTGAPWAASLTSAASGNPDPGAGVIGSPEPGTGAPGSVRHWVEAESQVVAQIDAEVQDIALCAQMLYTRYVPYDFLGTGAVRGDETLTAGSVYTNALREPKLANLRHQINFTMDGPGSITYRWKLQYGAYVQSPEAALRKVQKRTASIPETWQDIDPVGAVYWFDQGDAVRILAAASKGTVGESKALTGWMLGDGYYFQGECNLNTQTGEPVGLSITRDESNNPVARWLSKLAIPSGGAEYNGLFIDTLLRPVAVTWNYGRMIFYDPDLKLGEYMLQGRSKPIEMNPKYASVVARLFEEPSTVEPADGAIWDPNAKVLFPVKPGSVKAMYTGDTPDSGFEVHITARWPDTPHYAHIADTPRVQLTPDPAGSFLFVAKAFEEESVQAVVQNDSEFGAAGHGWTLLRFKEIKRVGRSDPKEYIALRTVRTQALQTSLNANQSQMAIIGQPVRDVLDRAGFGTGHLVYQEGVRYNPGIYDGEKLTAVRGMDIYDMARLTALYPQRVILHPEALPGPVIPVNEYPAAVVDTQWITIAWYEDPIRTDGILWPHAARRYTLRWPTGPAEGLTRIVIASEWGSESLGADGYDQVIADGADGFPIETTFNPTRFADLKIYAQGDPELAGYNPNEEHALLAPSFRYADVSPRPAAVYALRAGDLNNYGGTQTSKPYVLAQCYDNFAQEYAMRVFSIVKEDANLAGHSFANQAWLAVNASTGLSPATAAQLNAQPKKKTVPLRLDGASMEAGEPVPAFYPLGVVEGAVPCPEATGENLLGQTTFWKDHKHTRWAISGGTDAFFAVKAFYPLQPDFWWPAALQGATLLNGDVVAPQVGASVAFLPDDLGTQKLAPKRILYNAAWPRIAPVLKAGETITYSGGEYRADHPTMQVMKADGSGNETIQTPGLPAVTAFAVGEVVFDALNPKQETAKLMTDWTLRITQAMASLSVPLSVTNYPSSLLPAGGKTRLYQGKYIFKDLPSSLQKRFRYDPVTQRLEMRGVLNDKTIDDATLTASPAAVYALEPNILTAADVAELHALSEDIAWRTAVDDLRALSLNPNGLTGAAYTGNQYAVGLQPTVVRDEFGIAQTTLVGGIPENVVNTAVAENARAFGVGKAAIPNGKFLDPESDYPPYSWVTIAENNDPSMGGSPVALHVIKVERKERYRGAIKIVYSDNVFDENVVLRHTGDFGANGQDIVYEWWYRPDDGKLNVLPPFMANPASAEDWKLFPDLSGQGGLGRNEVLLKGDPNAPETLLADSWWFVRYRHANDVVSGTDWEVKQNDNAPTVNYTWAGAGNSDPFHDYDGDGFPDYKAQLVMGWIKRVLDAVNPYEARIRDFTGDAPATGTSMLRQLGPRYEGAVALNPDKDVIENVGLIELYQTILNRAMDLSINLSSPVSTPAIANALQLASTRLSDFYMLLGNEAYVDANDPTIGYGSSSVEYGAMAPVVHAFQNQASSLLEEELMLLRGQDDNMARPVYNRLFWNFTKGEGEAAYAMNYNISDLNGDGFIDEYDAMILYPQGHGDAWGHYLTALTQQYALLRHPFFNWVARSEFYNLMNVVMKVDFLDERKFAQVAAQKAKAGAEIVTSTYRQHYTEDENAQWQGYTDVNPDRGWGVQDWARRAGQGAYFDWVTANALLPSVHPNETLEGIQKVDRMENADIRVVAANLLLVQHVMDDADAGLGPLGISSQAVPFDINPQEWESGGTHFEQVYGRAVAALMNAQAAWDHANAAANRLRAVANTEQEFRNDVYQQDIAYRNQLVEVFGRPYPGTVGSGKFYPDGYDGPDITYYMYVAANSFAGNVPLPLASEVRFNVTTGKLEGGTLYDALDDCRGIPQIGSSDTKMKVLTKQFDKVSSLFAGLGNDNGTGAALAANGMYDISGLDFNANNNPLDGFSYALPVAAWQYSNVAPAEWGERPVVGELQQIVAEMLQKQIEIAGVVGSYQGMFMEIVRSLNLLEIQMDFDNKVATANQALFVTKSIVKTLIAGLKATAEITENVADYLKDTTQNIALAVPPVTPTAGVAVSPGSVPTAPIIATIKSVGSVAEKVILAAKIAATVAEFVNDAAWEIAEGSVALANAEIERMKTYIEAIAGIDSKLDNEGDLRLSLFAKAEQMRALGERYRSTLSKGVRILDEREAFNRRAAAMTQQGRYQDMAFRVERNAALQNYNRLMDIAARYAYLAAKAYDYDTNLAADDPASPAALFDRIVKERSLGYIADGVPQVGQGLAGVLAQLDANYGVMKGRLGLTNPQMETGKLSLRTEHFRIFPENYDNPDAAFAASWAGANNADDNWRQTLQAARVNDLWEVPEFRYLARPFNVSTEAEPGIVIRFPTQIKSGYNVFGKALSGGDHAYDPSVYATRIRSVGVWFSGYLAEDVLADLSATPRVYLIPTGADIMSIPNAEAWQSWDDIDPAKPPKHLRVWNVLDQIIPVPIPGVTAKLPLSNFVPLLDSLDGRIGQQRRFSSFRAYHDSGTAGIAMDELVSDSRLVGRSVWNTEWILIIPGRALNADPDEGLDRFIEQVQDIKLVFETYGFSGN